jgi:hypothetical protein
VFESYVVRLSIFKIIFLFKIDFAPTRDCSLNFLIYFLKCLTISFNRKHLNCKLFASLNFDFILRYLSVDFQLFIISPPLIYLIHKNCRFMWLLLALITSCSIYIFTFSMVFKVHKLPRDFAEGELYHRWIYHPTHAR